MPKQPLGKGLEELRDHVGEEKGACHGDGHGGPVAYGATDGQDDALAELKVDEIKRVGHEADAPQHG